MGQHPATLHTNPRQPRRQRAPRTVGTLTVLHRHRRTIRHKLLAHRRALPAPLGHPYAPHGRHRPQRNRPLRFRGRLRVAPRKHQPAQGEQQGRKNLRGNLRKQPRHHPHDRVHGLSPALRRRELPGNQSRLRSHNHIRQSGCNRRRHQDSGLRHQHPPGWLRIAHRHGRHKHHLP